MLMMRLRRFNTLWLLWDVAHSHHPGLNLILILIQIHQDHRVR
jgi:hypothetical protein